MANRKRGPKARRQDGDAVEQQILNFLEDTAYTGDNTIVQLANYMNWRRERAARELSALRDRGIVTNDRPEAIPEPVPGERNYVRHYFYLTALGKGAMTGG